LIADVSAFAFYQDTLYTKHVLTFKYRLYPTKSQQRTMSQHVEDSRLAYNHLLETKKHLWETEHRNLTKIEAQSVIDSYRRTVGLDAPSVVIRFAKDRLFFSYNHFFKTSGKFPRFKAEGRYSSFGCYSGQYRLTDDGRVFLPGVGYVKINLHRPWEGVPKQITVKVTPTGKWFISISCEGDFSEPLSPTGQAAGCDLGLETFATFSDGFEVPRKRFFKTEQENLAKAQTKKERLQGNPIQLRKQIRTIARIHERTVNRRIDFCRKTVNLVLSRYDTVYMEDLSVTKMLRTGTRQLSRSIADAAWFQFASMLSCKASRAGRTVELVDPRNTSRTCSACGHLKTELSLAERTYNCEHCGSVLGRDVNAARNIYRLGTARH
jgi:putative transposase